MKFRLFLLSALFCSIANASVPAQAAAAAPKQRVRVVTWCDDVETPPQENSIRNRTAPEVNQMSFKTDPDFEIISETTFDWSQPEEDSSHNHTAPAQAAAAVPSNRQKGVLIIKKDTGLTRKHAHCFSNSQDKKSTYSCLNHFSTSALKEEEHASSFVSLPDSTLDKKNILEQLLENIARQDPNQIVTAQAASAAPAAPAAPAKNSSEWVEELD